MISAAANEALVPDEARWWSSEPLTPVPATDPGDGAASLAISRAAIAGWADKNNSGIVLYVYGGALHATDGLVGTPGPLHSYVLAVTRSTDGTDAVGTAHRVIWPRCSHQSSPRHTLRR